MDQEANREEIHSSRADQRLTAHFVPAAGVDATQFETADVRHDSDECFDNLAAHSCSQTKRARPAPLSDKAKTGVSHKKK